MPEFDYRLVYCDQGSYLALEEETRIVEPEDFWADVRSGVAAVIALPLTILSYFN